MDTLTLLGHPFTIILLTAVGTVFGYLLKTVTDHGRALATLTEISRENKDLIHALHDDQRQVRRDLDELRIEHAELSSDHKKKRRVAPGV